MITNTSKDKKNDMIRTKIIYKNNNSGVGVYKVNCHNVPDTTLVKVSISTISILYTAIYQIQ